jgi:hypothetical protein
VGKLAKVGLFLTAVIGFTTVAPDGAMAWKGPCDIDYSVKSFAKLNNWSKQTNMCVGPLKVKPVYGVSGTPKTKLTPDSDFSDAEPCKIRTAARNGFRTFTSLPMDHPHPSINTRYLFLPFTSPDMPQSESPWSAYSANFNYIKDWLTYINDSDQKQTFTFEKTPVKLSFNVTKFDVNHGNKSGAQQFAKAFVEEASESIDFSRYDIVLVMPPAGTPRTAFAQGFMGQQNFGNTKVVFMSVPPATYTTQFVPHFGMISPHEWMHELYHAGGFSIQHHNGNDYWQNGRPGSDKFPGLGEWGLMNMSKTDLLGWEKWFLGYTKDSQVACLNPNISSTIWIKPDGLKNASKKLAVLPISPTKVMVFQSVRDYGVNYKLGSKSQGLLVWTVDTTEPRESYGVEMVTGKDRKLTKYPFVYFDAPLKKGEKVTAAGFEIKVIEAGKFGDVFSVTPAK